MTKDSLLAECFDYIENKDFCYKLHDINTGQKYYDEEAVDLADYIVRDCLKAHELGIIKLQDSQLETHEIHKKILAERKEAIKSGREKISTPRNSRYTRYTRRVS